MGNVIEMQIGMLQSMALQPPVQGLVSPTHCWKNKNRAFRTFSISLLHQANFCVNENLQCVDQENKSACVLMSVHKSCAQPRCCSPVNTKYYIYTYIYIKNTHIFYCTIQLFYDKEWYCGRIQCWNGRIKCFTKASPLCENFHSLWNSVQYADHTGTLVYALKVVWQHLAESSLMHIFAVVKALYVHFLC